MSRSTTVTLCCSGKYWKAFFYDDMGKRRGKSLGAKSKLSKRQAKVLCDRLAADLHLNPRLASAGNALRLDEFLQRYLALRTDLRPSTIVLQKRTARYLLAFFGGGTRIDRITRASASEWRAGLATGKLTDKNKVAEATVCQHVRNAKVIFSQAVGDDLMLYNPFDRQKGTAPGPDKTWRYVSVEELDQLLEACPSVGWRAFLGLCRLAGLRRGEALSLAWSDVDWDRRRLTVYAQKTGKRRVVPIEPELFQLILDAFAEAEECQVRIVAISHNNLRRQFHRICKSAGLEPWEDCFQVLRRNRETDWAQTYPQYVVSYWMGHGIMVSDKHYLQVPEELYDQVAASKEPQTATKTATKRARPNAMRS